MIVARRDEPVNPFYVGLIAAGSLFAITACAYFVMAWRALQPAGEPAGASSLTDFLREYGALLLSGELVILAIATVGAIGLDEFRQRRAATRNAAAGPAKIPAAREPNSLDSADD